MAHSKGNHCSEHRVVAAVFIPGHGTWVQSCPKHLPSPCFSPVLISSVPLEKVIKTRHNDPCLKGKDREEVCSVVDIQNQTGVANGPKGIVIA